MRLTTLLVSVLFLDQGIGLTNALVPRQTATRTPTSSSTIATVKPTTAPSTTKPTATETQGTSTSDIRTTSILVDYPGQTHLPDLDTLIKLNSTNGTFLNVKNIQGDILVGMKKPIELFYFFHINDPKVFKAVMLKYIIPLVTSTADLISPPANQPDALLNVAFTSSGLATLSVFDNLNDQIYTRGQYADASSLGDPGTKNWVKGFIGNDTTHGVFLIASDKQGYIDIALKKIIGWLGTSITETHRLQGAARPGSQAGHEHFGYLDGVSQPAVAGFNVGVAPGQSLILPGIILLGEPGDQSPRPSWSKDGSFLVFRQLQQLVPEWNKFLTDNPIKDPSGSLTPQQGSELLGARMIGRWKSGTPIDLSPLTDNGLNGPNDINNFDFSHPGFNINSDQTHCPFASHIRKTRPRADENNANTINQIMRAGIPYGPEQTDAEITRNATGYERGLAFVGYQSDISNGFRFQQIKWANEPSFPGGKSDPTPGYDPIFGQNGGTTRFVSGMNPFDPSQDIKLLLDFVTSRGGGYFFSPSIKALTSPICS